MLYIQWNNIYVQTPITEFSNQISISCWFYGTSYGEGSLGRLFSKGVLGGHTFGTYYNSTGQIFINLPRSTTDGRWVTVNAVSLNAWHHLVAIINGTNTPLLYIDNILVLL